MEKWDLYNAKREKSGITVCRGEIIPKGLYHLSVSVWIVNQQGQYLLSQRHPKKQYPLYWECTGGSVLSGETSLQGAIREVKEELGILLTPGSEKLIYQSRRENVQDFYDVWLFHKDIKIEEMRLQEWGLGKLLISVGIQLLSIFRRNGVNFPLSENCVFCNKGHLPVILSTKSKGSEDMKQILIVEDDSFLNRWWPIT